MICVNFDFSKNPKNPKSLLQIFNFLKTKSPKSENFVRNIKYFARCTFSQIFKLRRPKTKKAPMFESEEKHAILTHFSTPNKKENKNFWTPKNI